MLCPLSLPKVGLPESKDILQGEEKSAFSWGRIASFVIG